MISLKSSIVFIKDKKQPFTFFTPVKRQEQLNIFLIQSTATRLKVTSRNQFTRTNKN